MKDVAIAAGVSRQLVSLVMRGAPGPSQASRELILAAADELGFLANTSARLLRQGRTNLMGLLYSASNTFEASVVECLLESAPRHGFDVMLAPTTKQRSTEVALSQLLGHRIEALACFNPDPASTALDRALDMMPVVWLGERSRERRADVIRPDDEAGLLLLVGHLAGMGHVRIAYVGGLGGNAGPDREKMYRSAMEAHGLARHIDVIRVGFDEYDGAKAANSLLLRDTLPSAVVACSDQCAQGVLAVFRNAGVDVPGEVSVTGYDDTPVASLPYNELTTVGHDVRATAEATLVAIQQRIVDPGAAPTELATEARLIVRRTTGPARQGNPRRSGKDRIRPEAS